MKPHNISFQTLLACVPVQPPFAVDWKTIWSLWPEMPALDTCPQDPIHHAEGDVGLHTRMVTEALITLPEWQALEPPARNILFWAAVLHDIGKPATTKQEPDGRISARGHARIGTLMARKLLWECGAPFEWREAVCGIISEHLVPFWLIERESALRLSIQTSWKCRPDYLCLHSKADALGRICEDGQGVLDNIDLAEQSFRDVGCWDKRFDFANAASRVSFFEKDGRDPYYEEYEDFRCKVTFMSGLPGSGKDTWIKTYAPDQPVISLDTIRAEIGAASSGNQGQVIQAARERAREYLRAGQDFVWNATNITRQMRQKSISLARDYNAQTRIVYIEVPPARLSGQNSNRQAVVPAAAIEKMTRKLEPPQAWECHDLTLVIGE